MLLSEAIELFIQEKRIAGYSPKTVDFYENATGQLKKIAIESGIEDTSNLQLGVNAFLADLSERDVSQATIHTYWRATKTFVLWCQESQYVEGVRMTTD